jgi:hypothetical protein
MIPEDYKNATLPEKMEPCWWIIAGLVYLLTGQGGSGLFLEWRHPNPYK